MTATRRRCGFSRLRQELIVWSSSNTRHTFETATDKEERSHSTHCALLYVYEMRADWFLIEWLMDVQSQWCVSFPLKPTPLSRATGGRKGAGRQTDGCPCPPSQAAANQTQRRRRATTPTVLWLALMGLNLQQKVVPWLSIAFSVR